MPFVTEVAGMHRGWHKWNVAMKYLTGEKEPLLILTAIRHERPWRDWASKEKPFKAADPIESEHEQAQIAWFQWFEISLFEIGRDELEVGTPRF